MEKRLQIKGSTVLVTGGAGFIGSTLVDKLYEEGANQVVVIDNMFLGYESNLTNAFQKGCVLYKDDAEHATALEYIFKKHSIDIVFNCATKALNYSFVNPANAFDTNVQVVLNLLEAQRKGFFKTLCHFSTSEVYGTAIYEPMDEEHPKNPTTTYAAGKAAADLAVESWVRMFGLDAFIVRPFNNYGPRQNHQGYMAGVIPVTVKRIFQGLPPIIHGSGDQSRDFIYTQDTVDAVIKLYHVMKPGESVNISTDGQVRIKDLIQSIGRIMEYKGIIQYEPARGSDVLCHNASNAKVKNLITYQLTPFEQGLQNTVQWYANEFKGKKLA